MYYYSFLRHPPPSRHIGALPQCAFCSPHWPVITEMDRNYRSITEIFFLGGCLSGVLELACIGWRSITKTFSCFARNLGSGLGRLSGSLKERKRWIFSCFRSKYRPLFRSLVWVWLAALLLNWLLFLSGSGYYRNGQKLQKQYRNLFFCVWGGMNYYRNYSLSLIFRYGKKKRQAFFLLVLNRKILSCFARNLGWLCRSIVVV